MAHNIEWIRSTQELLDRMGRVGPGPLALDTESDSLHHYPERVCLMQLTVGGRDWLVDPLAGVDLAVLGPTLSDPGVGKILHGADYDLRVLHRDFGLVFRGLFDTMIAARLAGERAFGLAALLESRFGVRLNKKHQRADWSCRPLPAELEEYAATDTRHLEALADELSERLAGLGRLDWAEEEFERLEAVRSAEEPDPEAYRRLSGSGALDRRGLAALRELWRMREREARRRNRPPFKILGNGAILRVAGRRPTTLEQLREIPELARVSPDRGRRILAAVTHALELPADRLPQPRQGRPPRRDARWKGRMRALVGRRDAIARRLGLEPSLVAPRATLEAALAHLDDGRDLSEVVGLRRWQRRLIEPALVELAS